jgi:hypothetical protein
LYRRRRKPPVGGGSGGSSEDQQKDNSSEHHPTVIVARNLRRAPPRLQPQAGVKFCGDHVDFGNKYAITLFEFSNRRHQRTSTREREKP